MFNALSDFLIYRRVERRLIDLTCRAYERDVRACIEFLRGEGLSAPEASGCRYQGCPLVEASLSIVASRIEIDSRPERRQ